jgi:hypothetical protein
MAVTVKTWLAIVVLGMCGNISVSLAGEPANLRRADFSADPKWDGYGNRRVPDPAPVTRQHFGWRDTNYAGGKSKGEIGGRVQRSATLASYAMPISRRTLKDKLRASGRLAITQDDGSSGVLFGWFNQKSRGWRTPNSLALRVDGNGSNGYRLFYEYGTQHYLAGGGGAFEGPRYQTTKTPAFKPDGTSHAWTLEYEPDGANGDGLIKFTIDDRKYEVALDPGHKSDGAFFDRFGIWNAQTTGGGMELYFDDVEVDGVKLDFTSDPKWEGRGNDVEFPDRVMRPFQDFGFTPTNKAGGKAAGEIGGVIWRDDAPAYYADKVGPLTLDDELSASGTIAFRGQGSDSAVWIGWFDSESKRSRTKTEAQQPPTDFLGILLEGPSRIGHYFRQGYRDAKGEGVIAETGPVLHPDGKAHRWTLRYDPDGADSKGQIHLTLDDEKLTIDLRPDARHRGATFDRFGFFNVQEGGHYVEVYVDDLEYTTKGR